MVADYSGWYWLNDSPSQNIVPPALERLEQIKMPTMVIDGELDLAYNHEIAQNLARRIPDATLVKIAYAGHMANLEEPAEVNRALIALARIAHIAG
jgi:3-oxoadipate enol-lactonase